MTKEELKTDESKYIIELVIKDKLRKEAEEYAKKDCPDNFLCTRDIARRGYLAGAAPREKRIAELEQQVSKLEKYIKACWVEENLNDYSSYITNTSNEFRDLVKELNEEIRNGR